jgi:NADPH:quinone reductase
MRAVTVNSARELEVRDVPTPTEPPPGHVLIQVEAAAINHGDKTFLKRPAAAAGLNTSRYDIWGASASGRILSVGEGVPASLNGRIVAVYRSLTQSEETIGLWCERAVVPATSCVPLAEELRADQYSGALVNAITAHAFLEEIALLGHRGVVVTAGNSATGLAVAALARKRNWPALLLARSAEAAATLREATSQHVLVTTDEDFDPTFERIAQELGTTAVFDGVGGDVISRIAPRLPMSSTVWFYGFLAGAEPVAVPSAVFMSKNLEMKPFSNFNSQTVRDAQKLSTALQFLSSVIADPLFQTKAGTTFSLEQIEQAMAYEETEGRKAILKPNSRF